MRLDRPHHNRSDTHSYEKSVARVRAWVRSVAVVGASTLTDEPVSSCVLQSVNQARCMPSQFTTWLTSHQNNIQTHASIKPLDDQAKHFNSLDLCTTVKIQTGKTLPKRWRHTLDVRQLQQWRTNGVQYVLCVAIPCGAARISSPDGNKGSRLVGKSPSRC